MKGVIRRIVPNRGYGFITGSNKAEYFMHRSEYDGEWDRLEAEFLAGNDINVTFGVVEEPRGHRAMNIKRLEFSDER